MRNHKHIFTRHCEVLHPREPEPHPTKKKGIKDFFSPDFGIVLKQKNKLSLSNLHTPTKQKYIHRIHTHAQPHTNPPYTIDYMSTFIAPLPLNWKGKCSIGFLAQSPPPYKYKNQLF